MLLISFSQGYAYRLFSHDVTAAILVYQKVPVGMELIAADLMCDLSVTDCSAS